MYKGMPCIGNVYKWKHSHELYIIIDSRHHIDNHKFILDRVEMIPIDYSNTTIGVSREHPFVRKVCNLNVGDIDRFDCSVGCEICSEYIDVPDPLRAIDNIEFVAENIKMYILSKLSKSVFG